MHSTFFRENFKNLPSKQLSKNQNWQHGTGYMVLC